MVRLLAKKLLRDMLRSGVTYGICIMIVAMGFCFYSVFSLCLVNLEGSRDTFFAETNFPQVFAEVQQAPLSVAQRLAALPGVLAAEGRLTSTVRLSGGGENPPQLKLFSVTTGGLAQLLLSRGQFPAAGARQLALGDGFFAAHQLVVGDEISLVIEGRAETLTICGSGISPENIYMVKNVAELLPDAYAYDAAFISYDTMSSLLGQENMANEFVLTLLPGVEFADVKDDIEELLDPYGCYRVYDRSDQFSVAILQMEIDQVGRMSTAMPFLFLCVAAVILYITLLRLVEQQRTQAGTLMAIGFSRREIMLHYLSFGLLTGFVGGLVGSFGGVLLAKPLADYFRVFFSLPPYNAPISWNYLFSGTTVAALFCGFVGWGTARRLSSLLPAEALRPAAPKAVRASFMERVPGFMRLFTAPGVMAIRAISRNRRRTALAVMGMACAFMITAYLVSMYSLFDVFIFDYIDKMQRQDITVYFSRPVAAAEALSAVRHPAVEAAEGVAEFGVTLRGPAGTVDCSVQAIAKDSQLTRLYDERGREVWTEDEGIVLSVVTATNLGVGVGDMVELKTVYPRERSEIVPVTGIIAQYMGTTAYMSYAGAARVSDYRDVYTSVLLKAPDQVRAALVESLKQASQVALVENRLQKSANLREYMGLINVMMAYMALMGVVIGLAVIYTSSLIGFEELKREISTMMMLGLPAPSCVEVLSVGQWIMTVIAFIPGVVMTKAVTDMMGTAMGTEMFVLPSMVDVPSALGAAALTLVSVWLSSRVMLRKIRKLSPVDLLRERE